jgi:predicted TPR repeat methyltransferase
VELFEQALALAPNWKEAWFSLGRAAAKAGDADRAYAAFAKCLALDPADELGASLELARLGRAEIAAAPQAYVAALFDAYADDFDAALTSRLDYRAPALIASALSGMQFRRALDLGCGTGLCGAALRAQVEHLEGVDLSPPMIEQARKKGIYNKLDCASIETRLARDGIFDLIVAGDVFSYIGDLGPTLAAVAARLNPEGFCAFTVEAADGDGWRIAESLRFGHSGTYVERVARRCALEIIAIGKSVLRLDRGAPIDGLIVTLRKPAGAPSRAP